MLDATWLLHATWLLQARTAYIDVQSAHTQELFVADLDMTLDDLDESYADRPATTMRVPLPTHVQFSERRADGSSSVENVQLVRNNEALKVRFTLLRTQSSV